MELEWEKKISVSNKIIDEHHIKLFSLFANLKNEDELSFDEHIFKKLLMEIKDYTYYHFSYEERLMDMAGYPELVEHKTLHVNFMNKIDEIMLESKSEDLKVLALEVYEILNHWLNEHIMVVDKKYIEYLRDDK
ncbi:MAG: bacteriohemerythrin [Acidaminobacteraceae bacterium]